MDSRINTVSMKSNSTDKFIAYLTLLSGLSISAVAVYYSVAGLVSIFAAAAVPIIIMGVALELSKLVATVWLKLNWHRAPLAIKSYLIVSIAVLMAITSMGIFGYLSKAHLDQAVPTGDVAAKVSLIDEKIKTERDNIEAARKALTQMDTVVDQTMSRSDSEQGATKAANLRRSQQKERANLQTDIAKSQKTIAILNEERAPIASELRKVEAEVGPIKYIAALLYGNDPDTNLLEAAVRWVIITIVLVFDPLAVVLLLASQYSFQWFRKERDQEISETTIPETTIPEPPKEPQYEPDNGELTASQLAQINAMLAGASVIPEPFEPIVEEQSLAEDKEQSIEKEDSSESDTRQLLLFDPGEHPKDTFEYEQEDPVVEPAIEHQKVVTTLEQLSEESIEDLHDDDDDLDDPTDTNEVKEAKKNWKHDHPNDSLKRQKKMFDRGIIKKLPWDEYLEAKADVINEQDDAVLEAIKWAQEQQVKYQQNSEQTESNLWSKIQKSKK
jgi:hypothetical protein